MTAKGNFRNGIIVFSVFTLFTIICFIINSDWMQLHFVDSKKLGMLNYLIFGLYPLFFVVGFAISKNLGRKWVFVVLILSVILLLISFILTASRAFFGGTYEEFVRFGGANRLSDIIYFFRSAVGKFALVGGIIFTVISVFLVSKDSKLKDFLRFGNQIRNISF